ncbi:hypothetical protein [Lacrimispora indolis]|uniref:hypothetical protein n=1 Tax=Lacrimispora indolis TaxID=69825 RepID=UPI00045EACB8|nr:hypothetical protein [Lacrimispora indolis]
MNVKTATIELVKSIKGEKNFRNNKNLVLVGLSSSGKSKILKDMIEKLFDENIYFIDSPNRVIKTSIGTFNSFEDFKVKDVLTCRNKEKYFGAKDVFSEEIGTELILSELNKKKIFYKKLFKEVINKRLTFDEDLPFGELTDAIESFKLDNIDLNHISSGYQAQIRILMEVNFAVEQGCKIIIIDEYDAHLDFKDSKFFLDSLCNKYTAIRFIIVVHSAYTLIELENFDVLKIYKEYDRIEQNECVYFDSNDLYELSSIHSKIFDIESGRKKRDLIFTDALSQKIALGNVNAEFFCEVEKLEKLSIRENVLLEYIKGCK